MTDMKLVFIKDSLQWLQWCCFIPLTAHPCLTCISAAILHICMPPALPAWNTVNAAWMVSVLPVQGNNHTLQRCTLWNSCGEMTSMCMCKMCCCCCCLNTLSAHQSLPCFFFSFMFTLAANTHHFSAYRVCVRRWCVHSFFHIPQLCVCVQGHLCVHVDVAYTRLFCWEAKL